MGARQILLGGRGRAPASWCERWCLGPRLPRLPEPAGPSHPTTDSTLYSPLHPPVPRTWHSSPREEWGEWEELQRASFERYPCARF